MEDEDPAKTHVRKYLDALAAVEWNFEAQAKKFEAEGCRLVAEGQTSPPNEHDNRCSWHLTDWRTGKVLISGDMTPGEYDAAVNQAEKNDTADEWVHIDHVRDVLGPAEAGPTDGIPPTLANALEDWVGMRSTPDEEVAAFVGWTTEHVAKCREEN